MQFDQTAVLDLCKVSLSVQDAARTGDLLIAMGGCLDDLGMRIRSQGFLRKYEESVASGLQEIEVDGENDDLRSIFMLKLVGTETKKVLEFMRPQDFERKYGEVTRTAGFPTYYTIYQSAAGAPTVRWDRPTSEAMTLEVWNYIDMTTQNVSAGRSIAAIAAGTLAYFFGIKTPLGSAYYDEYKGLAALMKASDSFNPDSPNAFQLSKQDKTIRTVVSNISAARDGS